MGRNKIIILDNKTAYLTGPKAAVTFSSQQFIAESTKDPIKIDVEGFKDLRGVVPWGDKNNLPQEILTKSALSPIISAGMPFNISMAYGDGIVYGRYESKNGKLVFNELNDNKEINKFFEENDINNYFLEQCNDASWFYNFFPEIGLARESKKIIELRHKEAAFSRWEEMNPKTGHIEHHYYSAKWDKNPNKDEIAVTPVLSPNNTVLDLKIKMGIVPDDTGKTKAPKHFRYIVPVNMPTPGRNYYQKPPWYSVFESGWYDYAQRIPEFKTALIDNQMTIRYHVELSDDYFDKIFKLENISDPVKQQERIKKEYTDLNNFLGKTKNAGKSVISFIRYDARGQEMRRMKITVIENDKQGGEYIEDSEEASNILSYAMGVHPSLIGSSPGKNKTINGTEARELFIIKQALMKPVRDRIIRPLYIVKNYNQWPEDIHFRIPNLVLTTLDKGTGSEKVIS